MAIPLRLNATDAADAGACDPGKETSVSAEFNYPMKSNHVMKTL